MVVSRNRTGLILEKKKEYRADEVKAGECDKQD